MKECFDELFNINPRYSTSIAFILGLILVDNLNTAEQNLMGNWLIMVGQTILTNASCQNVIESRIQGVRYNINSKEVKSIYNPIYYDIDRVRNIIKQVYPDSDDDIEVLSKSINEIKRKLEQLKKD